VVSFPLAFLPITYTRSSSLQTFHATLRNADSVSTLETVEGYVDWLRTERTCVRDLAGSRMFTFDVIETASGILQPDIMELKRLELEE
jgi:hypothetical protein